MTKAPNFMEYFGFFFFTAVVFGFSIERSRQFWKRKLFWAIIGLFLLLHCAILLAILRHTGEIRGSKWPYFAGEIFVILRVIKVVMQHPMNKPLSPWKSDWH
jgi:hypothetical protein